jgi:MFS family permease
MNAVSLNMMGMNAFRILAPAATGFLLEAIGFAAIYYLMAGLYLFGAACMIIMPRTAQKLSEGRSAWRDIVDGFSYVKREKTMLNILVFTLIGMVCGMPFMQLMPMITKDILNTGASGQGILMTISGGGAIVGSLILASRSDRKRGSIMLVTGGIMAVALIFFAFSTMWWLSILSVIFVGLGQTGYRATGNALVQAYTEPEYRGRVMSFMMMGIGFSSLGTFFAGILAEHLGVQWAIGGMAILFAITAMAYIASSSRIKALD